MPPRASFVRSLSFGRRRSKSGQSTDVDDAANDAAAAAAATDRPASAAAESTESRPAAAAATEPRLSRRFSFGRKKSTSAADSSPTDAQTKNADAATPQADGGPSPSRRFSIGGGKKPAAEHDGRLVGEDVLIRKLDEREDLEGARGEAVLYDFYECVYHVLLFDGRRRPTRILLPPENLKKASGRR